MSRELHHIEWDGVFKTGKIWVLYGGPTEVKTWYFAPLWWVRLSCIAHGYGWPKVVG